MLNNFKNNPTSNDVNGFRVQLHIAYPFVSKRATEDEVSHHENIQPSESPQKYTIIAEHFLSCAALHQCESD